MGNLDLGAIVRSLTTERTVDIITTGRRTGTPRTTEIWTTTMDGRLYICGTPAAGPEDMDPAPRDWLANLSADPRFTVRLKQSYPVDLPARATLVTDPGERLRLFEAPQSAYYREFTRSADDFVHHAPVVRVDFVDDAAAVTAALSATNGSGTLRRTAQVRPGAPSLDPPGRRSSHRGTDAT